MADFALGSLKPRGTRRVVYCSDPSNTTRFMTEGRATPDDLRGVVRNYAEAQAIDTVVQEVFSQGWSHWWRGESCEWDARPHHQRLVPMMDDGVMPIQVYAEECHRHGIEMIAGFRMNDRHGHNADWFARLGQDKPHWILRGYDPSSKRTTDPRSYELGCALNYAEEEVRDYLFAVMEEVAERFDVDGIEFNFTRLPACFPLGEAEQSHAILTGFVRRVRAMLDAVGAGRGRRLLLGVRVLQHLEGCLRMGYDIPSWIGDRLIDYVVPGDIGFTDPNPRFEEFVRLARDTDCYVYPQVQEWLGYDHRDLTQTPEHYCATVRNFYGAGADGFSTQNVFDVSRFPMLRTLRDPERVDAHDRHYAFYPIWGSNAGRRAGYKGDFPYRAEEIILPRDEPGALGRIRFRLCEHLPEGSRAELLCRPAVVPGDEIEIDVNGQRVAPESIRCEWPDREGQLPVCRFALGSPPAVYGDNHLGMQLVRSAPGARDDVILHEVEVLVQGGAMSQAAFQTAIAETASIRSVRALVWRRFSKNRLAVVSGVILVVLYAIALFAPFFSAYHHDEFHVTFKFAPPQKVHFRDEEGRLSRPFVYARERSIDMTTLAISYREVETTKYPIRFFVPSEPYKLIGFIPASVRLFGVDDGATLFLWGTDTLGRDILSRVWTGAQVSLSVPLVGTVITIVLGSILGVASAYFGRMVDNAIQRIIELLISFPQIPLWIALSAAIPVTWPSGFVYLGVVVILSLIGWGSLARVVRGKVLAYRQEEYVMAARVVGSSHWRIINKHLLPGSLSHIIVTATLAVPGTILGESSLSFLGIGIVPPLTSWGVMLQDAQNVQALVHHLWLAIPGLMIILVVLCFNFFGDGLRDAADPFAT